MISYQFPEVIDDSRLDIYLIALERMKKYTEVEFDLRQTVNLTSAGMAILSCLVDVALERKRVIVFTFRSALVKKYAFLEQLSSIAKGNHIPDPSAYCSESKETLISGSRGLDLAFLEKFEAKFSLDADLKFDCQMILQELMQNALSHSGAERYFVYGGLWNREIHCGVLDMGVSIPAKLRQKYTCGNDIDYILLALEEGSTTRRERPGGLGLYYFRDILKKNRAKLTIASGDAQVRFYFRTRRSQKSALKYFLPGTWCFARIPFLGRRTTHENNH